MELKGRLESLLNLFDSFSKKETQREVLDTLIYVRKNLLGTYDHLQQEQRDELSFKLEQTGILYDDMRELQRQEDYKRFIEKDREIQTN